MILRSFFYYLLAFGSVIQAENLLLKSSRKTSENHLCDFQDRQKNYDAEDLLRCINDLSLEISTKETGRSTNKAEAGYKLSYRQKPFWSSLTDTFTSIFNESPSSTYQSYPLSPGTTSSHYQSTYPSVSGGTLDLPGGIGLNLFDALSSISRYDDYKCVPRILCEMASGKLPGRSTGKQSSGFWENLGKNTFMEWLTTNDIGGASPILNFVRATILGYSNRGNSGTCYRAFPRCPTDPDQLIYYLNNHNGGFFRFFDKFRIGNYPGVHSQQNGNYYRAYEETMRNSADGRERNHIKVHSPKTRIPSFDSHRQNVIIPNTYALQTKKKVIFPES